MSAAILTLKAHKVHTTESGFTVTEFYQMSLGKNDGEHRYIEITRGTEMETLPCGYMRLPIRAEIGYWSEWTEETHIVKELTHEETLEWMESNRVALDGVKDNAFRVVVEDTEEPAQAETVETVRALADKMTDSVVERACGRCENIYALPQEDMDEADDAMSVIYPGDGSPAPGPLDVIAAAERLYVALGNSMSHDHRPLSNDTDRCAADVDEAWGEIYRLIKANPDPRRRPQCQACGEPSAYAISRNCKPCNPNECGTCGAFGAHRTGREAHA